ncbi:hypothetical protein PVK06_038466 [Gossypium arboreum]|uniref:Uncharacterized protein n=1 Tax=Gossypium arboreum TaxID=29729 RepID=A0ABR0N094_GOSAR|nr:hypothetical protein PVK06_038466 [Gossypium arboreum]
MDKIRSQLQENTAMITCSKRETWSVIMNNHGVLTIVPTKIFSWQRLLDSHWSLSNLFTYFQSSQLVIYISTNTKQVNPLLAFAQFSSNIDKIPEFPDKLLRLLLLWFC